MEIIENQLFYWVIENIKYDMYPNYLRNPKQVKKHKKANCVDEAYFMGNILKNQYKIPVRFIFAEVVAGVRQDYHVWVQSMRDKKTPLDLDATSKKHRPGDTYEIIKKISVLNELTMFGAPTLKKGAKYL